MKYRIQLDKDGYLLGITYSEEVENTYELNPSEMNLEYLECYKLNNGNIIFDEEKYQRELAKEEFYKTKASEIETINEYRIIKDSSYNNLVTSNILLWIIISLMLLTKMLKVLKYKSKQK